MTRHTGSPICAAFAVLFAVAVQSQEPVLTCDVGRGWRNLGRDKCYKVFSGTEIRSWDRARDICHSYGSQLVQLEDQYESDGVGQLVQDVAGMSEFWIGLSNDYEACSSCPQLKWQPEPAITDNEAFWSDRQPNNDRGDCVYAHKNAEDYIYDRPFTWSFDKCVRFRPFVCQKMAIPQGMFSCFSNGFVSQQMRCNGIDECVDGLDELNCPGLYHYFLSGPEGTLPRPEYVNSRTYVWGIEAPIGYNVYIEFQNFLTESGADTVTIFGGSYIESLATQLAIISGNQGNRQFRSYNNMMLIKFTTDSAVTSSGFTARWGSEAYPSTTFALTAEPTQKSYTLDQFQVGGKQSWLGQTDYVMVIENVDPLVPVVTVEITAMDLHDGDRVVFYDGASPDAPVLAEMCNVGCDNSKLVYARGNAMYIMLRTGREITRDVNFSFKYQQGCIYRTTDQWGMLFSPGFTAGLNYPNFMTCIWEINSPFPISFNFDPSTDLKDQDYGRLENGDFLKMYNNGTALHTNAKGFGTNQLRGLTIQANTGRVTLEFSTSPTRSARGFKAIWSIGCPDPMFNQNTIMDTGSAVYYYTARMTLQCRIGYDFLQSQIPTGTPQVSMECGYKGVWLNSAGLNYREIPRCSPKYCGAVPNIINGYIDYTTGSVYEDVAVYKCFPGSVLSGGNGNITCQDNGRWSPQPSCRAAVCSFNSNVNIFNGRGVVTNGNGADIGSIVEYTCNSGYELVGEPIITCQEDGQYSNAPPTCRALTCYLPEVENQVPWVSRIMQYNTQVTLTCMTGYQVSNSTLNPIRCQADRTVTEVPMCVDVDECVASSPCSHGCVNNEGSFTCLCPSGYRLEANGRVCQDINECLLPELNNCDGDCQNLVGSYVCVCRPPYVLYTENGVSGYQLPAIESGLLPTDTFHLNHSCVLNVCPAPDENIANAKLLTRRAYHRVGDFVEYQCNLGNEPRLTLRKCENNAVWSDLAPSCLPASCPPDAVPGGLVNRAAFNTGFNDYGAMLYLNCTVGTTTFSNFRHCTYNPATDSYQLQGSPYECGTVDCGDPEGVPGSVYSFRTNNRYGSSFTFSCNDQLSGTSNQGDTTVRCEADGNWDFGSLTCRRKACSNPGFPAGGDIVATSLADQQEVNFRCNRAGYALSHEQPLICVGDTFFGSPQVPTCVDVEAPMFFSCERNIILPRYASVAQDLMSQRVQVTDNTGIQSLTISPRDANTTMYLTGDETIVYEARDFAGNSATCSIGVTVRDETPPTVTCPGIRILDLTTASSSQNYDLTPDSLSATDNKAVARKTISTDSGVALPGTYLATDLYRTYTYTGQVTDTSDNIARCRGQIFVRPSTCSDLSFRTPLNSQVTFNTIGGTNRATVTCEAQYTLLSGYSQAFTCQSGVWGSQLPACIRDVTKPVITCPQSRTLEHTGSDITIDFTNSVLSVTDNNRMEQAVFTPESKTFTAADLYQTTDVRVEVRDGGGNVATCHFQYTLLPARCSPASFPTPLNGEKSCTATADGYRCTATCINGYVLRGYERSHSVSCTSGSAFGEVFTSCIRDVVRPALSCPRSRSLTLRDGDDRISLDFNQANSGFDDYIVSDNSGEQPMLTFLPQILDLTVNDLNNPARTVVLVASDGINENRCTFQITVLADRCSPLSLTKPDNGPQPTCAQTVTGGWTCNVTCNSGFVFPNTAETMITTSCSPGNYFFSYVPGCVQSSAEIPKQFLGRLVYYYEPTDGTANITESCIEYYRGKQIERKDDMSGRLAGSCIGVYARPMTAPFITSTFRASLRKNAAGYQRILIISSDYTILTADLAPAEVYQLCSDLYNQTVNTGAYTFRESIPGNGDLLCPPVQWVQAEQTLAGTYCFSPYYEAQDACLPCPAGTESDGRTCSVCPVGEYSTDFGCTSCQSGTTRYPGAKSQVDCVAPCQAGSVSDSGYQPCVACPVGQWSASTQSCTPCGTGLTTAFPGASDSSACVPILPVPEPCPQGTTSDGSGGCRLCERGSYGIPNSDLCQSCPNNQRSFAEGGTDITVCQASCPAGYYSDTGMPPCTQCAYGSSYVNSTYCQPCQPGFMTEGPGSLQCLPQTQLRVKCPRGMFRNSSTQACDLCPVGTYNSVEEGSCQGCGNRRSTYWQGATSAAMCFDMCAAGFYSASGLSPCQPCGTGSYWVGPTECRACPNAGTTLTTTATSMAQCYEPCPAGWFSFNGYNVNGACRQCPPNHYQPSAGSSSCIPCAGDTYHNVQGATAAATCVASDALCGRCANGATCRKEDNSYYCECQPGYYGRHCDSVVDHCSSLPCYNNGICTSSLAGFTCSCRAGTTGPRCETIEKVCDVSGKTCLYGDCIDYPNRFVCLCQEGFGGDRCNSTVDICTSKPCNAEGTVSCQDVSFDLSLRRKCICKAGYEGKDCEININDCASDPCINGGTCTDLVNGFFCSCPSGYRGRYCHIRDDRCSSYTCDSPNSICVDDHFKEEPRCICEAGYSFGAYTEYDLKLNMAPEFFDNSDVVDALSARDCRAACDQTNCLLFVYTPGNSKCNIFRVTNLPTLIISPGYNTYIKIVTYPEDDFWTVAYSIDAPTSTYYSDEERRSILNGIFGLNICGGTEPLDAKCCLKSTGSCDAANIPLGMTCSGDVGSVCTGSGNNPCSDFKVLFKCAAHRVFSSNKCQRKNDYCSFNPCERGTCQNIVGQGYRCNCPAGYAGLNCQTDVDECANNPCLNDGTCIDKVADYECQCDGFEGKNCENPINYCARDTCNYQGSCQNERNGYICRCYNGYTGINCETMINLCDSNPCLHDSTCSMSLNDYSCQCQQGYYGKNCEMIYDNCLGSQCRTDYCLNLFNNYYCKCPPNTYGRNCENQPNPCSNYNKCVNGNCELTNMNDMTCSCPERYEGDGCEILRDLCGVDNQCKNGAECRLTTNSYQCVCPGGYTGVNCETEINECAANPCTGGAECFDDINRYFCKCPLGMTGADCSRAFDPNYDLYFHHPQGMAYAWIPYFINVENLNKLTVSLWVKFSEPNGQGVYMTQFYGNELRTAEKFMEFTELGVKVFVPTGTSDHMNLQFNRLVKINDGQWHLVQVTMDFVEGYAQLYTDTIKSDGKGNNFLKKPNWSFRMWVVLGCEFDVGDQACTGDNSFHGYLSQVTWYKRMLTFQSVGNVQGEIPYLYANPQALLEPKSDLLLVWNGYILESLVDKVTLCSLPKRTQPCTDLVRAADRSYVTNCPADLTVASVERVKVVNWVEPTFHNLPNVVVDKNYSPGVSLSWGSYHAKYIATSSSGQRAYCSFNIYVQKRNTTDSACKEPPAPLGGDQTCTVENGWKGCVPRCLNSVSQSYLVDRYTPEIFTCGPSGEWNTKTALQLFRYPSCGAVQPKPRMSINIGVVYKITTAACNATKVNMRVRIGEEFVKLQNLFSNVLCREADCSDIDVVITCGAPSGSGAFTYPTTVAITVPNADATTNLDGEVISVVDYIKYFVLSQNILNFDTIADGNIDKPSFTITSLPVCPVGQVIIEEDCVVCGPGNFFKYVDSSNTTTAAICEDCPIGTYQDSAGSFSCIRCPNGQTTEMSGTNRVNDCKKICTAGYYFNKIINDCQSCDIGYYQPLEGQFSCNFCTAGFTTEFPGSTSVDQCKATCLSGYQISTDTCEPCPIGQFRDADLTTTCQLCPTGVITQAIASTSQSDCNIPACLEGSRYQAATNSCVSCSVGDFQDEKYQTSCKSCGNQARYSTLTTGATSRADCFYYCPSGFEVETEGTCNVCDIGTYKDNSLGLQSLCTACPPDYRTPTTGATTILNCTIYKCPVGYAANAGNTGCEPCALGYYQDVEYSVDCRKCEPDSYSTRDTASTSSADCEAYCDAGYEKKEDGSCVACTRGFYKDNNMGLFSNCTPCSSFYTTLGSASTSVLDCKIRTCPPGTRISGNDCIGCEMGTYQPLEYQTSCLQCPPNKSTRTVNATSETQCEDYCQDGYEMTPIGCQQCDIGYYKNNADGKFNMCELCPIDSITAGRATTSIGGCNVANCTAGSFLTATNVCEDCSKGTYQPQWWQNGCIQCGLDKTTEETGADNAALCILVCQPGEEDAGGFCQPCARGYWKSEEAAATCKPCPPGRTTVAIGSKAEGDCSLPACLEGSYLDTLTNPNQPSCKTCPYDSYQDEIWMESCKPCLQGKVSLITGAKSSSDCVSNCSSGTAYNYATGQCEFCKIGYYRNQFVRSQTACQLCPSDYITEAIGSDDASKCTVANCTTLGEYRDTVTETCKICPLDTYTQDKWQTECTPCGSGFGTTQTGSDSSADCFRICSAGTYLTTSGTCASCPLGTYKANARELTCTSCPNGLLTANVRQTSIDSCTLSPCSAGEKYNTATQLCSKCPFGFYQPAAGQFDCIVCPYEKKYTPREGATSDSECTSPCQRGEEYSETSRMCEPCRRGYFQPQDNQFTCIQCPANRRFTTDTGATSTNQCFSPCDNSQINDCSDNATCSLDTANTDGYKCTCFNNYDDVSNSAGRQCVHQCDRGYCNNGGSCTREPTPVCSCSKWYEGSTCQSRISAEKLSSDTMDIVIPVSIGVGGLILFLILLAVCMLCWSRHKSKTPKTPSRYSEFNGERMDKASLHSYDYGQRPYGTSSRVMTLAPQNEVMYDNSMYTGDPAVYQA